MSEFVNNLDSVKTILFFDTETNGLPIDFDLPANKTENWPRLLQISWVIANKDGELLKSQSYYILPVGFAIKTGIGNPHAIPEKTLIDEGVRVKEALIAFSNDVASADLLVGHNIKFDITVIQAELIRAAMPDVFADKNTFCTMIAGTPICNITGSHGLKYPKLQELYKHFFGKEFGGAHDASNDVNATMKCFFEILKTYRQEEKGEDETTLLLSKEKVERVGNVIIWRAKEKGTNKAPLYGLSDAEENTILPFEYREIGASRFDGFLIVVKGGWAECPKTGLMNTDGKIICPCEYDHIYEIGQNEGSDNNNPQPLFAFRINHQDGLLNSDGSIIIPALFEPPIKNPKNGIVELKKDGETLEYDMKTDNLIWNSGFLDHIFSKLPRWLIQYKDSPDILFESQPVIAERTEYERVLSFYDNAKKLIEEERNRSLHIPGLLTILSIPIAIVLCGFVWHLSFGESYLVWCLIAWAILFPSAAIGRHINKRKEIARQKDGSSTQMEKEAVMFLCALYDWRIDWGKRNRGVDIVSLHKNRIKTHR